MTATANITLMRLKQVSAKTGLPRSSDYAQIAKGNFPSPIHLSAKAVAWPSNLVDNWIASRIAGATS